MKLFDLKQERATLTNEIRSHMNAFDNKEMLGEDKEKLVKMENRFDEIMNLIGMEEKQIERERAIAGAQADPSNGQINDIFNAFRDVLSTGTAQAVKIYNALQQDNPTQAGYLVAPQQFVQELIKGLDDATFMRRKARVLPPLKGAQSLGYPSRTARMGAAVWGTEIAAPTADTTLAFGKREFKPNPATAEILLSKTLVRNFAGIDGLIKDELAYVFGALEETAYMTGDGVGKPLGLFTASADGITVARDVSTGNTATEIKFDGLFEAKYAVKDQYQANCEWIFHRDGIKKIAKLKDSDGQYIWQPSVALGVPDMLLSKPINISEYAPNTFTASQYVGVYGDLKNYWICDSQNVEIQVLNELYARTNQVDYMARFETDGAPVLAEAFARIKLGT